MRKLVTDLGSDGSKRRRAGLAEQPHGGRTLSATDYSRDGAGSRRGGAYLPKESQRGSGGGNVKYERRLSKVPTLAAGDTARVFGGSVSNRGISEAPLSSFRDRKRPSASGVDYEGSGSGDGAPVTPLGKNQRRLLAGQDGMTDSEWMASLPGPGRGMRAAPLCCSCSRRSARLCARVHPLLFIYRGFGRPSPAGWDRAGVCIYLPWATSPLPRGGREAEENG